MFKDITLGQYFPGDSAIHRLDPRTKLLGMIAYIVMIFFIKSTPVFLVALLFVLAVTKISGVPLSYLMRSLKPLRFILVFMFVINLLTIKSGNELLRIDRKSTRLNSSH